MAELLRVIVSHVAQVRVHLEDVPVKYRVELRDVVGAENLEDV